MPDDIPPLVIRADAGTAIGSGHVMRCLALAQSWRDGGGRCIFVTTPGARGLLPRIEAEVERVCLLEAEPASGDDLRQTLAVVAESGARWLLLDGYHFRPEYQMAIKKNGCALVVLDDNREQGHYYADYILNQNVHAREDLYPPETREAGTRLLLGPDYTLLRREFRRLASAAQRDRHEVRRIMVCMGGGDPDNVTARVLLALAEVAGAEVECRVIVGASNPHYEAIATQAGRLRGECTIIRNADDTQMAQTMLWADIAISAAGSTVWEMSALGLPALLLVIAENQRMLAREMAHRGCCLAALENLGHESLREAVSSALLASAELPTLTQRVRALCDGRGANRLRRELLTRGWCLSAATPEDSRAVWLISNDPATRRNAFSTADIPWDSHKQWFSAKLADGRCLFLVARNEYDDVLGQIRFDREEEDAVITVSLAACVRGLGLAERLIREGVARMAEGWPGICCKALVKVDNQSSLRAFAGAGFTPARQVQIHGVPAQMLLLRP